MRRTVAAAGDVSPDVAWERYAVIARWPSWALPIRRVEASSSRLGPGVTGVVYGPAGVRITFVVEAVDEVRRTWSWRVRCGPVTMTLWHEILNTSAGGTAATVTVSGAAPVVLLYPEVARVALSRLVDPRPLS